MLPFVERAGDRRRPYRSGVPSLRGPVGAGRYASGINAWGAILLLPCSAFRVGARGRRRSRPAVSHRAFACRSPASPVPRQKQRHRAATEFRSWSISRWALGTRMRRAALATISAFSPMHSNPHICPRSRAESARMRHPAGAMGSPRPAATDGARRRGCSPRPRPPLRSHREPSGAPSDRASLNMLKPSSDMPFVRSRRGGDRQNDYQHASEMKQSER